MNKEAWKYFAAAGIALVLTVINLIGLRHDQNAAKAAEAAAAEAKRAVDISSMNSKKLDRNYQRTDEIAKNGHGKQP